MSKKLGFGDQLAQAMGERGPLCVGIDPHPELLKQWRLEDSASGLASFSETVIEAVDSRVAALKPQVALFERLGSAGFKVLEEVLAECRRRQILVIADAKRGDIGSTMSAYAQAWLGRESTLSTDSVTLSPYLGFESLRPALDIAQEEQRGVFVLALTSNPEGKTVQHMGGRSSVALQMFKSARDENERVGFTQMGSCGLVIGATVGDALQELKIDLTGFNGPILAPGYGAQGATAESLFETFRGIENQILVNSSRDILRHGNCVQGLIDAIELTNSDLMKVIE